MSGISHDGLRIGVLLSHLRTEEKLILGAMRERGVSVVPLFDRELVFDLSAPDVHGLIRINGHTGETTIVDAVLDRSVVHSRAGYSLSVMERWGIPTLNTAEAVRLCDDKAQNSLALEAAGVPTPRTLLAYSIESALAACEAVGYPAVFKPVTGSWGRLLAKANGPEQAKAILEQKIALGSYHHSIIYVQEFVPKPDRDIRAYLVGDRVLAASYRTAEHWVTNAARGAVSVPCPVTPEIEVLSVRACAAVGARLAGVDLIETADGLKILEVNTGGEFRGLMTTTDVDIAAAIAEETIRLATQAASGERGGASTRSG